MGSQDSQLSDTDRSERDSLNDRSSERSFERSSERSFDRSREIINQGEPVSFIVTHTIRSGEEENYELWNKEIFNAVTKYPGYLGREIFRPVYGSTKYTIIVRFDNYQHLIDWVNSDDRKYYIEKAIHMLAEGDQHEIRTGIDFWFTPENIRPPKPYKQILITMSAIYPLTMTIPPLLTYLLDPLPFVGNRFVKGLISAAIICSLMSYVIMPRYTQFMKNWLYDTDNEK